MIRCDIWSGVASAISLLIIWALAMLISTLSPETEFNKIVCYDNESGEVIAEGITKEKGEIRQMWRTPDGLHSMKVTPTMTCELLNELDKTEVKEYLNET